MRKVILIYVIVIISITATGSVALGASATGPVTLLNLYSIEDSFAIGLQNHLSGSSLYGTANIEYWDSLGDLRFQVGAVYYIPREVLLFRFYSGAGVIFSRNDNGYKYPYLLLGTRFLFFFSEVLYPWANETEPVYRVGLSLDFSPEKNISSTKEIVEEKPIQYDYNLSAIVKQIKIENTYGTVNVKTGVDEVVSVTADIEMRSIQQKSLNLYRNDIDITGEAQGDSFIIKAEIPKSRNNILLPKVSVKMTVYVPAGMTVVINGKEFKPSNQD